MCKKLLIFGGTTEGRELAELCTEAGISCTVCVATDYGEEVLGKSKNLKIINKRLDEEEMVEVMSGEHYVGVIDATHPYATLVSENIKNAANSVNLSYIRLEREQEELEQEDVLYFESNEKCSQYLESTDGKILLTTGSKELSVYAKNKNLRERLIVRVLPGTESITICKEQQISGKQIIAMQGPFSKAMNEIILNEYGISYLVTKISGKNGGFTEKIEAARSQNTKICLIGIPEKNKDGRSLEEVIFWIQEHTGCKLLQNNSKEISMIGIGMGNINTCTVEAVSKISEAELVIGSMRLLDIVSTRGEKINAYLAKDIIPILSERKRVKKVAILMSGDSGFYSGTEKLSKAISDFINQENLNWKLQVLPGISSLSYLASKLMISWNDVEISSLHGRSADVREIVLHNEKSFFLLSGREDIEKISFILQDICSQRKSEITYKIYAGYELSYPAEKIYEIVPGEVPKNLEEGLYSCLIVRESDAGNHIANTGIENATVLNLNHKTLTCGMADEEFIRGKVPMTKEEVRTLAISKLRLHRGAILYDIGCGTGSVAIECAKLSDDIQVYGIEKNPEGVSLICENIKKFGIKNLTVIEGEASEKLTCLPPPTHVFIGGSGGKLEEILLKLAEKSGKIRIVITAISLETIANLSGLSQKFLIEDESDIMVQISRSKKIGNYHLMQGENPIMIYSFVLRGIRN